MTTTTKQLPALKAACDVAESGSKSCTSICHKDISQWKAGTSMKGPSWYHKMAGVGIYCSKGQTGRCTIRWEANQNDLCDSFHCVSLSTYDMVNQIKICRWVRLAPIGKDTSEKLGTNVPTPENGRMSAW